MDGWIFPVFEILLRVTEGDTWQEAFLKVLPERKNARPIAQSDGEESRVSNFVDVCDDVCDDKEGNDRLECDMKIKSDQIVDSCAI